MNQSLHCSRKAIFLPVLFVFFLSGCGTTAAIQYKVDSPKQVSKRVSVYVKEFEDLRPQSERGVIGKIQNAWGADNGNVNEPPTLMQDLKTAMEQELVNAGYSMGSDQNGVVVTCSLMSAKCNFPPSYIPEAQLRIHVIVLDHNQEVINHIYKGEGTFRPLLVGLGTNEALTIAAKKTITAFIEDLDRYIKT